MAAKKNQVEITQEQKRIQDGLKDGSCHLVELSMRHLVADPDRFQGREKHIDVEHSHYFSTVLAGGGQLEPVVAFWGTQTKENPQGRCFLADGHHRHDAHLKLGKETIRAYVFQVPDEKLEYETIMWATMCNQRRSLARTKADIKKACWMLFSDPEAKKMSNLTIANHCGIAHTTAGNWRLQYEHEKGEDTGSVRLNKNGRPISRVQEEKVEDRLRTRTRKNKDGTEAIACYLATIDGVQFYLGAKKDSAIKRYEEITNESELNKRKWEPVLHSDTYFREWSSRKGVSLDLCIVGQRQGVVSASVGHGFVVKPSLETKGGNGFLVAIASVFLVRKHIGDSTSRAIVVYYDNRVDKKVAGLANSLGIETMSPKEFIESVASSDSTIKLPEPSDHSETHWPLAMEA